MSIPLDRLYNFLDSLCDHDVLIYRFFPHGSKKLEHLLPLTKIDSSTSSIWYKSLTTPVMICHDQEPLEYNLYTLPEFQEVWSTRKGSDAARKIWETMHLRSVLYYPLNAYDRTMLCHSEKNSSQLEKYENNGFVGVYWWSHGVIAQDWFRFAQHDPILKTSNIDCDFLIYNRAWSGTREYRLKFVEQLIDHNLVSHCKTSFSIIDNGIKYIDHQYANTKFRINRKDIEHYIPNNTADSTASADYNGLDYQTSAIEVVLETIFDDQRWHLTEKSLRPIACGRPFILASTPGSLEYLRSYGIKTFNGLIDESYDTIQDPVDRLAAITAEMKRIAKMPIEEKQALWIKLYKIAKLNQELFFSARWHNTIVKELVDNLNQALETVHLHRTGNFWKHVTSIHPTPITADYRTEFDKANLLKWLATDISVKKVNYLG